MENCTVVIMQEGYSNIQYEEVVTAQDASEVDGFGISNISGEFEEATYEVEIEEELIYEESLPVYKAVTVYEEIIENIKTPQKIIHKNPNYSNILTNDIPPNIPSIKNHTKAAADTNNKVPTHKIPKTKPLKLPTISKNLKKPRTFEKSKNVKKLKNICEGALCINLGENTERKNVHRCFLCDKTFIGYDRHVSKANVIKHITKYHLTGKIANKPNLKMSKKNLYGFVGSLRILAKNALISSSDKNTHKCFICGHIFLGIRSLALRHINSHTRKNNKKDDFEENLLKNKEIVSFGFYSDTD